MSDLAALVVQPLLRGRFGEPYLYTDETTSTQLVLLGSSLREGATAVAEHQTAGRGRQRRVWSDTAGRALLCSVMLRPPPSPEVAQLALVAGLAVAETLESMSGATPTIKWPNDVLLNGGKIAGILLERHGDAVVCGIGINANQRAGELPVGGPFPPTSLFVTGGVDQHRGRLLAQLLERLERRYDEWLAGGIAPLIEDLASRDALRGRPLRVGDVAGVGAGIERDGSLRVMTPGGEVQSVVSGEVALG